MCIMHKIHIIKQKKIVKRLQKTLDFTKKVDILISGAPLS